MAVASPLTLSSFCTEESAGGFLLTFPSVCLSAGFSLPSLPFTLPACLGLSLREIFKACRTVVLKVSILHHSFDEFVIFLAKCITPGSTQHCHGKCTAVSEQKRAGAYKGILSWGEEMQTTD